MRHARSVDFSSPKVSLDKLLIEKFTIADVNLEFGIPFPHRQIRRVARALQPPRDALFETQGHLVFSNIIFSQGKLSRAHISAHHVALAVDQIKALAVEAVKDVLAGLHGGRVVPAQVRSRCA